MQSVGPCGARINQQFFRKITRILIEIQSSSLEMSGTPPKSVQKNKGQAYCPSLAMISIIQ